MTRISLIMTIVAALTVTLLISTRSQTPPSITRTPQVTTRLTNEQQLALQKTVTTQQRINRYFHSSVVPKVRNCWSRVQGQGTVAIEHTYTRNGGKWEVEKLTVRNSTLPRGQEVVALKCLQEAVRATSFPVQGEDSDSTRYVVRLTWPVPFPADLAEQARAMFIAKDGGSGTGCGGTGIPPDCYQCVNEKGVLKCKLGCSGYYECNYGPQDSCELTHKCVDLGLTGVAGRGTIIY